MTAAMGLTHRKKTMPMTSGLITRCRRRPKASHAKFNGCSIAGRKVAVSAKITATPRAHQRGKLRWSSGNRPMIAVAVENTKPKLRSELFGVGSWLGFGSRTVAILLSDLGSHQVPRLLMAR